MKNRHGGSRTMTLLSLLIFFGTGGYAQSARDPKSDLSVSFSSRHEGTEPGSVFGVVSNKSANNYPCVLLEFDLSTRFDLRAPGEESRSLGVLAVELQNLQPRGEQKYEK